MSREVIPTVVYEDRGCLVATWQGFVFPVMGSHLLPAESVRNQVRVMVAHGDVVGRGKLGEITLIATDAPLPEAETRSAFDDGVPQLAAYYGCVSAVYDAVGFRGAMVRGMLTSFQLLSRQPFPQKVFSRMRDAAEWSFPHAKACGMGVASSEELHEALRWLRRYALSRGIFREQESTGAALGR